MCVELCGVNIEIAINLLYVLCVLVIVYKCLSVHVWYLSDLTVCYRLSLVLLSGSHFVIV